ncbi:MAG: single-stranded-DNA-specific exonuclease RecJ [Epsilonproteobacteria bacterium]|nr:single-stranded-DNA-specific exonuclease RecJ [Campylobacterota bacterium]
MLERSTQKTETLAQQHEFIQGTKYYWKLPVTDLAHARQCGLAHNLGYPIAQILCRRGYDTSEKINSFLFTTYEKDVPHAGTLKDIEIAVERINRAINRKEKILIFGDYDVDGITSSSIMLSSLIPLGANINYFLPNRKRDGYGLSSKAVKKAHASNYALIITVDNGITAYKAANDAYKLGIDLIITDHHRPHGTLPKAIAIINPQQADCPYSFKSLAGVGVAFKLVSLLYEKRGIKKLPEKTYELLMLGTVADVVPLVGENRFWVRHGLNLVNQNRSYAMQTLVQNSGLEKQLLDSLDIGFMIAPQLNALGRLDDARDGVRFLISSNQDDVAHVGAVLKNMNEERKKIERSIYAQIEQAIINRTIDLDGENVIIASNDNWPAGVIGLVAGKLMHNYGKPTLIFHIDAHGTAKGSCRSIPEFDIFNALEQNKDLLLNFGGHTCAAGLSLDAKNLPLLKKNLEEQVKASVSPLDLQPKATIDAELELPEINYKLMDDIARLEPFGNSNPAPLFLIRNVTLQQGATLLKERHVRCSVFSQGIIKPVIFFNRPDLLPIFDQIGDQSFNLLAQVMKNEWQGVTRIDLQGLDISL